MIKWPVIFTLALLVVSCKQKFPQKESTVQSTATAKKTQFFFPVTSYLKGQLKSISEAGINPIKYTTINSKMDSAWVKIETLALEAESFLQPEIDTANVSNFFEEKNFLDQTINAYTFSYDPLPARPKGFAWERWDVYVDPATNKVKRVYLVKILPVNKTQQLTWQTDKWFKIVTIANSDNNTSKVEKEVLIKWDF
ncbi:MAG: hypothetical protein ABIO05_09250 [Ferruginibacter sp.]